MCSHNLDNQRVPHGGVESKASQTFLRRLYFPYIGQNLQGLSELQKFPGQKFVMEARKRRVRFAVIQHKEVVLVPQPVFAPVVRGK